MADRTGPQTLKWLIARLLPSAEQPLVDAFHEQADAWPSERLALRKSTMELEALQKKVDLLEQDRKWWQANAVKRHKRAIARKNRNAGEGR